MTPRRAGLILALTVAAIALGWALMAGLGRLLRTPTPDALVADGASAPAPAATADPAVPKIKATLYFATEDGLRLAPTPSLVPLANGLVAQARAILETQLTARPPAPLVSTIPPGTTLRGIFVSERNEVFVDLGLSIRAAHTGGSVGELLTVYTIVNALLVNLPTLQEVQILIDGYEADTLAGHVDLRRPLKKNETIVVGDRGSGIGDQGSAIPDTTPPVRKP